LWENETNKSKIMNEFTGPRLRCYIQRHPFLAHKTDVLLIREHAGKRHRVEMRLAEIENDAFECPATFSLSPEDAQNLVDELHRNGFRPTEHVHEQSALPYITSHLNDMRRLVFMLGQESQNQGC
jgi:hypothetical protein